MGTLLSRLSFSYFTLHFSWVICKFWWEFDEFQVKTEDGYNLSMQRAPVGWTGEMPGKRLPVLLRHGLLVIMAVMCGLQILVGPSIALGIKHSASVLQLFSLYIISVSLFCFCFVKLVIFFVMRYHINAILLVLLGLVMGWIGSFPPYFIICMTSGTKAAFCWAFSGNFDWFGLFFWRLVAKHVEISFISNSIAYAGQMTSPLATNVVNSNQLLVMIESSLQQQILQPQR